MAGIASEAVGVLSVAPSRLPLQLPLAGVALPLLSPLAPLDTAGAAEAGCVLAGRVASEASA